MGNIRIRELNIYQEEGLTLPAYNYIFRCYARRRPSLNPNCEKYRSSIGGYGVEKYSVNISDDYDIIYTPDPIFPL